MMGLVLDVTLGKSVGNYRMGTNLINFFKMGLDVKDTS